MRESCTSGSERGKPRKGLTYLPMPPPKKETGKKAVIIGAGPAALTAAYYLRNAGHSVTVIDKMDEPGGLLMYAIPEYRMPKDKVRRLTGAIANMGVEFR